jgi:hypothetical protein
MESPRPALSVIVLCHRAGERARQVTAGIVAALARRELQFAANLAATAFGSRAAGGEQGGRAQTLAGVQRLVESQAMRGSSQAGLGR